MRGEREKKDTPSVAAGWFVEAIALADELMKRRIQAFEGLFRPMPLLIILFVVLIIFGLGKLPMARVYPVGLNKKTRKVPGLFVESGPIRLNLFKNGAPRRPEA
jgi:hypothetical protein